MLLVATIHLCLSCLAFFSVFFFIQDILYCDSVFISSGGGFSSFLALLSNAAVIQTFNFKIGIKSEEHCPFL